MASYGIFISRSSKGGSTARNVDQSDAYLSLHKIGGDLHDNRLDAIRATPSCRRQKLQTDSAAVHHETSLDPWCDDPNEGWCERELLGEDHAQQYVRYLQLAHVHRQFAVWIDLVQPNGPFEHVVVDQINAEDRIVELRHLDPVELLHQSTETYIIVAGLGFAFLCK